MNRTLLYGCVHVYVYYIHSAKRSLEKLKSFNYVMVIDVFMFYATLCVCALDGVSTCQFGLSNIDMA